jgi:alpha,alpha-trehalose phosphorylase
MGDVLGRILPNADFALLPFTGDRWRLIAEAEALALRRIPALFAIGDGFVGLRGPGERAGAPRVYLNGVFEKMPISYHESAHGFASESDVRLAVADATTPTITIDGIALGLPDRIELDMARGMLVRHFSLGERQVRVEQFTAMAHPGLVMTRVQVIAGTGKAGIDVLPFVSPPPDCSDQHAAGEIHDPRLGPSFHKSPWSLVAELGARGRVDRFERSQFAVAALVDGGGTRETSADAVTLDCVAAYAARRGEGAHEDALADAEALLALAAERGFDALAREQEQWFSAFWEDAFVSFPKAPHAEQAIRHGLFQLIQAVGRGGGTSIGAKGQTGEGYEGHVFWDAEAYVLPALLSIRPELARDLLVWRIDRLEPALANARLMGQSCGALYPWRTIDGSECSAYFPGGAAQYHINADIALALSRYLELTGDNELLVQGAARMLVETARIWLEIGFHDPERGDAFVINRVTGPDEYSALVNNNLYTNALAAEHLRFAARIGVGEGLLDANEAARMVSAADAIFLPFDTARAIYSQDDAFFALQPWPFETTPADCYPLLLHFHPLEIYRHRVAKQADAVLLLTLFPGRFDDQMRGRMLDIYEALTVHDSTLSASAFATAAAQLGDAERAARYWRLSVLTDLLDLFGNSHHGLHMAALAGGWTALTAGFGGMRIEDGKLGFAPAAIPEVGPYVFRVHFRERQIEVTCGTDGEPSYRLVSGEPLTVTSHGIPIHLVVAGERVGA